MRLVAIAAAAALCAAGPAAAASSPPPVPPQLHAVHLVRSHARTETKACMAQVERAKVARWLAPVACEQPPRSQLLLAPLFGG